MTIEVTNGKRFSDEPVIEELTEGDALALLRTSTGVKSIKADTLRQYMAKRDAEENHLDPKLSEKFLSTWQKILGG
jgi:hypothetical protein